MTADVGFYLVAAGAVISALAVVTARDLVHAALAMVAHFVLTAALYVLLHAPFVAAAQLIVYAGAIMVLFLFVVMILGGQRATTEETLTGQRVLAVLGLVVLTGLLVAVTLSGVPAAPDPAGGPPAPPDGFGSPAALAEALFRWHVLPFEIVSVLLLIAMIGAVALARRLGADAEDEPPPSAGEVSQ